MAAAGYVAAMPFDGDPAPGQWVRVVPLPGFVRSPDVFTTGMVVVLVPQSQC